MRCGRQRDGTDHRRESAGCAGDRRCFCPELQQVVNNEVWLGAGTSGDCDGSGDVSIVELQKAVNCLLGTPTRTMTCLH